MNHSKFQKIISSFLLFFFFFGQITGLSIFSIFYSAYAESKAFSNVVSIIVDENTYDELDDKIERYALDIQNNLENTRAVILPIKENTTAFDMASMNESLFNEGYTSLSSVDFESKLIGTVLIGKLPIAVIEDNGNTTKSIMPFVDFFDKGFIYDHDTKTFKKNSENINGTKAEIWHGVISPNTGDSDKDIEKISDFLDKDHDFYSGDNNFKTEENILNGKKGEPINSNYKPYVFYFDGIREQKSISYSAYKGYEAYMNNIEDINYNRYSKELAEKVKNEVLGAQNDELNDIVGNIDSDEIKKAFSKFSGPDLTKSTDIVSKEIIDGATNNLIEIFNKGSISNFRTNVHNAGRYNEGTSGVNVDIIPYFVSVLDLISAKVIKSANTDLETQIDELVKNSLSRKIAIPNKIIDTNYYNSSSVVDGNTLNSYNNCNNEHLNFLYGKQASGINTAKECSIYRGSSYNSGTLVESNRGLNINFIEADVSLCSGRNPKGYYGGSSPLNLDRKSLSKAEFSLGSYNNDLAIRDTFSIIGSKRSSDVSKNPSPLDCLDNNFLTSVERLYDDSESGNGCYVSYAIPVNGNNAVGWSCGSTNKKLNFTSNFISDYRSSENLETPTFGACSGNTTRYENGVISYIRYVDDGDGEGFSCNPQVYKTVSYKFIPSYIEHKSPTIDEINVQLVSKITPNLPIDKDRYIDFISSLGEYKKINYPYLFRLSGENEEEVKSSLDKYLKEKSDEINDIISSENPNTLSGKDLELYNILKVGDYNSSDFDLVSFLKNKPLKEITIDNETKSVSYYDFLVFSIYWNSLNNISAKYKFVFENYLSDQVGRSDFDYILAKNKKQYEIAYLGAPGDSKNMYVKIDPNDKKQGPYSNILSRNNLLNTSKLSIGAINSNNKLGNDIGLFKCAPPEGVPIWEWFPAIQCWLTNMLPPEISIGEGTCGESEIFESSDDYFELLEEKKICKNDSNKNGVNDCVENKLENNANLKLTSDNSRYFFNNRGNLKTEILDKNGKRILLDDSSYVSFNVKKIVDRNTNETVYDNSKDKWLDSLDTINEYLYFKPFSIRSSYGTAFYSFSTKSKPADIYFESTLDLKDYENNDVINIKSNDLIVKVRNERLFLESLKINELGEKSFSRNVVANDDTNLYLVDGKNTSPDTSLLNKNSLVFSVSNFGDDNLKRNLNFPIKVTLKNSKGKIVQEENLINLAGIKKLSSITKSGDYSLEIKDRYEYLAKSNFSILASTPSRLKLDLGTSILENNGVVSTNVVSIYDKFDNIVSGDIYDFDFSILGDNLVFEENEKKQLIANTFEGFKAFRLKSSSKIGVSKVKVDLIKNDKKLLSISENVRVLQDIKLSTKFSDKLEVGNNRYSVDLDILDSNSKLLSDLSSRVYLTADNNYIELEQDYTDIVNGKAKIYFYTKTKSKKDLNIRFKIEGFNSPLHDYVTIFPGEAMNIELISNKNKLKASIDTESYIKVELRDIYNNVVFTDNSSIITLKILNEFKRIISSNTFKQTLKNGTTSFKVNATEIPGTAYLKFTTNGNLEKNKFILLPPPNPLLAKEGESKGVVINGVSENALKLETFFFYGKDSIEDKNYNALYTTLLGASYGDISSKDYLAGAMLFDKKNRSLAVTSLLNNPYNIKYSVSISEDGIISKIYNGSDLSQDLSIKLTNDSKNHYYLDIFNKALNIYVGKIYLNFDSLDITEDMYNAISEENDINLKQILNISDFKILEASNKLKLDNLLKTKKNSLIIYLETNSYDVSDLASGKSSSSKGIYYHDPFTTEFSLNSFSRDNLDSYDNFAKNGNLGWKAGNKTLMSFSAGNNVGESTKDYMGVNTINLGDPVISLKKIKQTSHGITKKFDKTIGTKLNNREIRAYKTFDYNSDSRKDILLIEESGFLSLLENKSIEGGFLDQKNLARIVDIGDTSLVNTGDFSGDKYEDIFFVNNKGNPFLLNNNKKDFTRIDLTENFALKGKITDAKSFDMDNDGITDIVTLDSFGEINIFYGKSGEIEFEKKTIYSGYGIKLTGDSRNDMGALYFKDLVQNTKSKTNSNDSAHDIVPTRFLENLMFEKISYDPEIDSTKENYTKQTSFIKSEFASESGIDVEKSFIDKNGGKLQAGDIIEVNLTIKNISNSKVLRDIVYLENIPEFFDINLSSIKTDKDVTVRSGIGNYKFMIDKFDLNPRSELKVTYSLKTKVLKSSYIKVGLFEFGESGNDEFGDIIVSTSKYNCGGDNDIFRSTDRKLYEKGIQEEKCDKSALPEELAKNDIDTNNNGIPDYIDDLQDTSSSNIDTLKDYTNNTLNEYNNSITLSSDENIFDSLDNLNSSVDNISSEIDNLIQGFGCGFGGGSCFGLPVNWAPLAAGNDPVVFGKLVGDGLKVDEGLPVFSALTGLQMTCGSSPCCIPVTWPVSSSTFIPGPRCGGNGAGGSIGANSPTNFFRLYATPTLTGGAGIAACFGGPASAVGAIPPEGVNPVVPGGNCIVAAAPLPNLCSDEEINSDPGSIGQVNYFGGNSGFGVINGNCSVGSNGHKKLPVSNKIDTSLARAYLDYRKTGIVSDDLKSSFESAFKNPAKPGVSNNYSFNEPLLSVNDGAGDESDVSVSFDISDGITFKGVQELSQDRVAGFPSFITQWVNDQLEEFITKLTDFPTLFVILPDFSSIQNADWGEYSKNLKSGLKKTSGIKEAYEFLGNIPFVSIEATPVNINIPWIDKQTLNSTKTQWLGAIDSYNREIEEAKDRWSYGASCDSKTGEEKQECLDNNSASERVLLDTNKFISSLQTNLSVLESYGDIPEKLAGLANKKQDYLEQILCNVDNVQEITGGRLDRNGKRFKSWVELYVLIKAILKSWQLLADLFIDYDAECHECKNERNDSIGSQFELVSMITPKIPVIKFPKWPDIVLDLHSIRLNLNVALPEFNFNKRPIILPPAPRLKLPDSPGAGISLPDLPILPNIEIPELPDLPSLPTVKLPDLPPPPKLPKLFASIEGVLNILKLITKAMCILKKSPFVPESRAGDQIALLTESSGYRPFDFIDLTMPQFSYPFVDEINVKTFVNLEFDAEFLVEMAKTVAEPINETSNNFYHMFDKPVFKDIDLSESVNTNDVNIKLGKDNKTGYIDAKGFLALVNKQLSSENIIKNPKLEKFRKAFDVANNYTYSKENKLIEDLNKTNLEKFDILKSIIKKEIKETNNIKKDLKNLENDSIYRTISDDNIDDIKVYNSALQKYNTAFKSSAYALVNPSYIDNNNLEQEGKYVIKDFKNNTKHIYKNDNYVASKSNSNSYYEETAKNYFALNDSSNSANYTCNSKSSNYERKYEGIYVLQEKDSTNISYKLFDYLDDLDGDEIISEIDFDLDSDIDLLYSMDGNLYLKENLIQNKSDKIYYSSVITLNSDSNKFLNGNIFYESPNNVREGLVSDKFININFEASRKNNISNYRLEYYDRIDKYLNKDNIGYIPKNIKNNIVDSFVDNNNKSIYSTGSITKRNNLAYMYEVGNNIAGVKLKTKKLLNIKDSIKSLNVANISIGTRVYAGKSSVKITYLEDNSNSPNDLKISPHTNIELDKSIKIIGISGDAYIFTNDDIVLTGSKIYDYLDKPLSFESSIKISNEFNTNSSSHIGIRYYDSSEALLDFRKTKSYTIYDLGLQTSNYSINLSVPNDYLYSNLSSFKNNVFSTRTAQVLLSPQLASDKYAPEIDLNSKIRIPVYIEKLVDLTDNIYENAGMGAIDTFVIEGIETDKYEVLKTDSKLRVKFGKFDTIFTKKIKFIITDKNGNVSSKDIDFEIYTPAPEIQDYSLNNISGFIDENINGEPINIYRYRGGIIKRLETSSGSTKVNTDSGKFDFKLSNNSSNLIDVKQNDSLVFSVNEETGKIILSNPLYKINTSLNLENFIEISVLDQTSKKIFSQVLKSEGNNNDIIVTDDFDNITKDGIYFKLNSSDFDYYELPDNVDYNPGSLAIYRKTDINKSPLFAILRDSRIKILDSNFYKIEYSSFGDYIVLKLLDKHFNKVIGELLFKMDNSYVIK